MNTTIKSDYSVAVWVGNYGTYEIPWNVEAEAKRLNAGKRLDDERTRGAKYIKRWGVQTDENRRTAEALRDFVSAKWSQ